MSGIGNGTLYTDYSTPLNIYLDSLSDTIATGQAFTTITGEAIGTIVTFYDPTSKSYSTVTLSGAGTITVELTELTPTGGHTAPVSYQVQSVDSGTKDGFGNEIYTFSAAIPTATLSSGTYIVEALGLAQANQLLFAEQTDPNDYDYFYSYTAPAYADLSVEPQGSISTAVQYLEVSTAFTPEISTNGRYLVYQDAYNTNVMVEEDLQTGGDYTFADGTAPPVGTFGASHIGTLGISGVTGLPYYSAAFTAGGNSFSVIGNASDYGFYNGTYIADPAPQTPSVQPVAVSGASNLILLNGEGVVIAASDSGDVVVTATDYLPYNGLPDNFDEIGVQYLSAPASISINQVAAVGDYAGAGLITLTGTSDAIGQTVEIDSAPANNYYYPSEQYGTGTLVGLATVQSNGSWSLVVDPANLAISSTYGLFLEASVLSADGVPGRTGEIAANIITIAPTIASVSASPQDTASPSSAFAGDTITIQLESSDALTVSGAPELVLSNGDIADFSGTSVLGYPFVSSPETLIDFTYTPSLTSGDGPLTIVSLDLNGGSITDAANDPLATLGPQSLGITEQSAPVLLSLSPLAMDGTTTNAKTPDIYGTGIAGDTVTVFDGGNAVGSGVIPNYSSGPSLTEFYFPITLTEGAHTLTASVTDGTLTSSYSNALDVTVDTTPPSETITGLTLNGTDLISLADQADGSIVLTGSLSAPLAAGDSIVLVLPGTPSFPGIESVQVTIAPGATSFSADLGADAAQFGVSGTVSAYVENAADNQTAPTSVSFTAAASRVLTETNAGPATQQVASASSPAISADGTVLAFEAIPTTYPGSITGGIYIEDLANQAAPTLAVSGAEDPVLSGDGSTLAFISYSSGNDQLFVEDLQTGTIQLVSQLAGVAGNGDVQSVVMSADGKTIAFADDATNLTGTASAGEQIFIATLANGQYVITGTTPGDAGSSGPALSADGTSLAFTSTADNLVSQTVPANTQEIYIESLAATGSVALVSAAADGTAADAYSDSVSVSGDGRYAVFDSDADNLIAGVSGTSEIYLKDLKTGAVTLVSASATGAAANGYSSSPVISADGRTVVFTSTATNLVTGINIQAGTSQLYAKDLITGAITLLSAPGAIAGNASSQEASLSADGSTAVFASTATNLVAQTGTQSANYSYDKPSNLFVTSVPTTPPVVITTAQTLTTEEAGLTIAATGSLTIGAGGNAVAPVIDGGAIEFASGSSVTGTISFTGTGGVLVIDANPDGSTTVPANTITGFAPGDTIELAGVPYVANEDSYTVATAGTLTIDADGTYYTLNIAGAYVGETGFVLSNDIQITEVTCYVEGTRILTTQGEVEVQNLAIGDMLPTLHGGAKRIKWIGVRGYDGRFIAGSRIALPVCIKAGALGSGIPARDLWVSPGHAICFGDALVHASRLVNGVSIIQAEAVEQVTYYHIEMESHEIIFAENCPAETFMDEHFRQQFHNAAAYEALYPGEQAPSVACLPRLDDGFQLHGIQSEINHRAGINAPELDGPVRGYVDAAGARVCSGWAQWALHPEVPVCLDILAGGKLVGNVLANRYREDVHAAGYGSGFHGFEFLLPEGCSGGVEIRQTGGGAFLAMVGQQEAA
jgi:Tol biopolymer transport system component